MSENQSISEHEVGTAIEIIQDPKQAALEAAKAKLALSGTSDPKWMESVGDLDWKRLPPFIMAQILIRKPYKGKRGEQYYLSREQALMFAMRCFEVGLSPLSSEVWFNPETCQTNITAEGQKQLMSNRGVVASPAMCEGPVKREWPMGKPVPSGIAAYVKTYGGDVGYKCTIEVLIAGKWFPANFTAWLSEWYKPSPTWDSITDTMLRTRAEDKCRESITGVGQSGMPEEKPAEIEPARAAVQISSVSQEYKPINQQGEK